MNKIYIGNLSFKTTDADLDAEFRQFGEIKEVALVKDRFTGESKGFGFITYAASESAKSALSLDGKELGGRAMKVSMAIARAKDDRRGGGDGHGGGRGSRGGHGGGGGKYGNRRERW